MTRSLTPTFELPTVTVLGRDATGCVAESDGMRYYLTDCCAASAKGCDGYVGCRACYRPIDDALGGAAMAPEWPGGPLVTVFGDGILSGQYRAILAALNARGVQ
jgi:hypothetical protein